MFAIKNVHLKECTSTQDEALKRIPSLEKGTLLVLSSDFQTGGRGRLNRKWIAPEGKAILVTFAFQVDQPVSITQVLAIVTCRILEKLGFKTHIKWPNDLILNGKKVGGVLAEVKGGWVIAGLGLNVNQSEEDLDINRPATSLLIEGESKLSTDIILGVIAKEFREALVLYSKEGFQPFEKAYSEYLIHKQGEALSIEGKSYSFQGVNSDGSLRAGEKTFYTGEVS